MKAKDSCTDSPLDPKDGISITWHEQPSHSAIIPFTDLALPACIFQERSINSVWRQSPCPIC